ncbi:MAG: phytochelatin synthase family protein [Alphaproteobacteria bacterium]|nr:phytochelatin synthase family protein [Alphaproteobacteria bacterium]
MRISLLLFLLCVVMAAPVVQADTVNYGTFTPGQITPTKKGPPTIWNSFDGKKRLARTTFKDDYYQLADRFQPQRNPLYCGIASAVIVLNTLRLEKGNIPSQTALEVTTPEEMGAKTIPFPAYSQETFLNEQTDAIKPRDVVEMKAANAEGKYDPGLTLQQLSDMLHDAYGLRVERRNASWEPKEGVDIFRNTLKKFLREEEHFIIVNFDGKQLGAATGGHISPVAAYDKQSDTVMILDVAGHKNPWYWVTVTQMYDAMHTLDGEQYRGYLIVADRDEKESRDDAR